jgi:D-arginine dehydrogenase
VAGVDTDRGPIAADAVVLAAGAWSGALASAAGLRRPLVPVRRTILEIEAPAGADGPWIWIDDAGVYLRPDGDRFLACPCDEQVDAPGGGGGPSPAAARLLRDKLDRYVPAAPRSAAVAGWTGLRTFAPDRRPILGPDPAVLGLHWAAGLGGFGVTTAPAVGEAVASWIEGRDVPWLDRSGVSPGRDFPRRMAVVPDGRLGRAVLIAPP